MQQRRVHARLHARNVDLKSMPCFGEIDLAKTMICLVRNTILNLKSMPCYGEVDSIRLVHVRLHARLHARNVDLKSMPCSREVYLAKIMICLVCDTIFDLKSMLCYREVDSAKTSPCQTARTRSRLGELVPLERGELPGGWGQGLLNLLQLACRPFPRRDYIEKTNVNSTISNLHEQWNLPHVSKHAIKPMEYQHFQTPTSHKSKTVAYTTFKFACRQYGCEQLCLQKPLQSTIFASQLIPLTSHTSAPFLTKCMKMLKIIILHDSLQSPCHNQNKTVFMSSTS